MSELRADFQELYEGIVLATGEEHEVTGVPFGHIHAYLVDPDLNVVTEARLEWKKDGDPVSEDDLEEDSVLPAEVGHEGEIRAERLPLGRYEVTPRVAGGPELAPAELPWISNRRRDAGPPHLQRVHWAEPEEHPAESDEPPEDEELLGVIHASLVDPDGEVLTDAALEWTLDGRPAAEAPLPEGASLPERLEDDGVIRAEGLPPGTYVVRAVPEGEDAPRYRPVRLPWQREEGEDPHFQRLERAS